MKIDYAKARHYAAETKRLLEHYAPQEPEAALCLRELQPLIDDVLAETARLPVPNVGCGWYFLEGELRKYNDLESAYSSFAVAAMGYNVEKVQRFLQRCDSDPKFEARMLAPELTWWETIQSGWQRLLHRLK